MDRDKRILLDRIEAFDIDGGPRQLSFAARLARENDWTVSFAERVIAEYKRFAFLTITAGHPCTPSDQVDQAWHLHLTYTRSYWERFCGQVLPRPLHHNPTEGGKAENAKFDDWYARTLESYEQTFGHAAPPDIWPDSTVRFGDDIHFARVNTRRNWVIPKRRIQWGLGAAIGLTAVGGCASQKAAVAASIVAGFVLIFVLVALLIAFLNRRFGSKGGNGSSGCGGASGCSGDGADGGGCGSGCGGD